MLLNLVGGGGQNSEDISAVSGQTESLEKPDAPSQYEPVTGTEEPKGQPEREEQSKPAVQEKAVVKEKTVVQEKAVVQEKVVVQPAVKKKITILMVGNSMTARKGNTTIKNLRNMAKKSGQKVVIKYLKSNDEKMKNWANPRHKSGKRLYREIRSGRWDYIIFQEQTKAATKQSFVRASEKLGSYIHSKSPRTQIIYNCTWAYKKGKKISGKYYSFNTMQKVMNKNYQSAASKSGGSVCWSGKAFALYRKSKGKKKNLYIKDNNHASKYGWYLNACCLYRSIFGKSAAGIKYYGGIGKNLAKKLQKVADKAMN